MKILKTEYPHLFKEWHTSKNGELKIYDFSHGSKKKIWWRCEENHVWEASIVNRTVGRTGCPYCAGKAKKNDSTSKRDLNLIRYILTNNKSLRPIDIANKTDVSLATISRWKYGAPIPEKAKKTLIKIAGLKSSDLENSDFAILVKEGKVDNNWLEYMAFHFEEVGIELSNKRGAHDPQIVAEIKRFYVTLNKIGVPIDAPKTYPPRIEEESIPVTEDHQIHYSPDFTTQDSGSSFSQLEGGQKNYTPFDLFARKFANNYSNLNTFFNTKVWTRSLHDHQKISQAALKLYILKIALLKVNIKHFVGAGSDRIETLSFFHKTKIEAMNLVNEFCLDLKKINEPINFDYFDLINKHPDDLNEKDLVVDLEDDGEDIYKYLSFGERKILEAIKELNRKIDSL